MNAPTTITTEARGDREGVSPVALIEQSVYRRSVAWIRDTSGQTLFRIVVCLVLLDVLMEWHSVPRPLPANAPAQAFSAERALIELRKLVGNNAPHPVGSAEDGRIRGLLVDRLRELQLEVEVRDTYGCSEHDSSCSPVHNVVARIPGRNEGKAVLVVVHYDSVPAGPGASDDGSGVAAALEVARALSAGPALRHPVILLFNEGEEFGLLGAEAFAASDPWMKDVGAVVNADARGTSGPSRLFETSGSTSWIARHVVALHEHLRAPPERDRSDRVQAAGHSRREFRLHRRSAPLSHAPGHGGSPQPGDSPASG
jgi:hypothetical protein